MNVDMLQSTAPLALTYSTTLVGAMKQRKDSQKIKLNGKIFR